MPVVDDEIRIEPIPANNPLTGRHIVHDPRARDWALPENKKKRKTVHWERRAPVADQNHIDAGKPLGCCTSCAGLGVLSTEPFWSHLPSTATTLHGRLGELAFTNDDILTVYSAETHLDDSVIPGSWPPADTGSSGLWLMRTLRTYGLISGWRNGFSPDAGLDALQFAPLAAGTLWLNSMFEPRPDATLDLDVTSGIAGGHEYAITGYVAPSTGRYGWVEITNSWGETWGDHGRAYLREDDFAMLLRQRGDIVQPTIPS